MTRREPLRIGIVGAGLVCRAAHLPELRARPDSFDVVGLVDPDRATRERTAAAWGIERTYANHRELLDDEGIDALVVCSPNGTHLPVALDALEAGLHLLVEKPLCLSPDDGQRIAAIAAARGLVVQVGYMKRFDPAYEALVAELPDAAPLLHLVTETFDPGLRVAFAPDAAAAAVPAGAARELAEETAAQTRRAVGSDDPAAVRLLSDVFLGALVHDVNLVRGLLEATGAAVEGIADAFAGEHPDRAGGTVTLAGGARWTMAWLHLPGLGDFRERVVAYAVDGIRTLEFPAPYLRQAPTVLRRSTGRDGVNEQTVRRSWQEAYGRQLDHFHECVRTGTTCRTPAADAVEDLRLLCALFRAATGTGALGVAA